MCLRYLLLVCFVAKTLISIDARPRNLLADAFSNQDSEAYIDNLTASDQADTETLNKVYQFLLRSGIKASRDDYANLAKNRYPALYTHIVEFNRKSEDRENSLPEKARQFILDRRAEIKDWFPDGEVDVAAATASIRQIGSDIAKMNAEEKTALFQYYPHMQELLENPYFKAILEGSGRMDDELIHLLDS